MGKVLLSKCRSGSAFAGKANGGSGALVQRGLNVCYGFTINLKITDGPDIF
jgi:hypothetical protein